MATLATELAARALPNDARWRSAKRPASSTCARAEAGEGMANRKVKTGRAAILAGRAPTKRGRDEAPAKPATAMPRERSPRRSEKRFVAELVARIRAREWGDGEEADRRAWSF